MWLIFEIEEIGFDGEIKEDVFFFFQIIHDDFIILFKLAVFQYFNLFSPETDLDRFLNISNCDPDDISLFLETMNVLVGNFIVNLINNSNHIDHFQFIFFCDVDVLGRFMIEMEPIPWQ